MIPDEEMIEAGANALAWFFVERGGTPQDGARAVIEAVLPLVEARLHAEYRQVGWRDSRKRLTRNHPGEHEQDAVPVFVRQVS